MSDLEGALGFSLHTGWAAAVVVIRDGAKIEAIFRRRLELLPAETAIPRFVYHSAAELSLEEAAGLVESARAAVRNMARQAIQETLNSVKLKIRAAGIPGGSTPVPSDLSKILGSHALIHAAEGYLFQQAVLDGCRSCGISGVSLRTREVWPKAAALCGMDEKRLRSTVDSIGKTIGPPWTADQKIATASGLIALLESTKTRE
jgi:hypothetical protein